eukprot:TRINITY_DN4816_c0_g1_i2.p1 TRINITY_DN4816_c0_g1~~TRINITY_DN4816_c0_g1_i2.p1  ORF type:complete len:306 (+),score=84.79 TRINITY_DN4816_c0_g1_i2:835-1752(+)
MEAQPVPELLRSNLAQVVLLLMSLGIDNLLAFDFVDAPPPATLLRSLELLYALGALSPAGKLTKRGRRMAELPLEPLMAAAVVASEAHGCTEEVITICAMLSVAGSLWYRPKAKAVLADAARAAFPARRRAASAAGTTWHSSPVTTSGGIVATRRSGVLKTLCRCAPSAARGTCGSNSTPSSTASTCGGRRRSTPATGTWTPVVKALTAGYFPHACRLTKAGLYRTVKGGATVHVHPSSALYRSERLPRYALYHELVLTSKAFMRAVSGIEPGWLREVAPHYYTEQDVDVAGAAAKMPRAVGRRS